MYKLLLLLLLFWLSAVVTADVGDAVDMGDTAMLLSSVLMTLRRMSSFWCCCCCCWLEASLQREIMEEKELEELSDNRSATTPVLVAIKIRPLSSGQPSNRLRPSKLKRSSESVSSCKTGLRAKLIDEGWTLK